VIPTMGLIVVLLGYALWALAMGGLLSIAVLPLREMVFLIWLVALIARFRGYLRRRQHGIALAVLLVQVAAMTAVISLARYAPVKTRDRLLARRVILPKAEMSLAELRDLAELPEREGMPLRVSVSYPETYARRVIRWPTREMTLREFIEAVEAQTPLRHRFASCGNGFTVLWGEDCGFGLRLGVWGGAG
jgi:hypothetical protein